MNGSTIRGRKRVGSLERPIGVRGETGRLPRSAEDLEIPGRVAPARSDLPPRGASDLGRSDVGRSERGRSELLCGRDELLLVDGRPDEGLPLDERPDVEPPLDGREDGREPLEGGRRDSISILHSEWYKILTFNYKLRK